MKRINGLFKQIVTIDNLKLAEHKARRNKSHRFEVIEFDKHRELLLLLLLKSLIDGTYKTSKYNTFIIYEPKEREIFKLPYYPDRIVHHAIMNILEPMWISVMIKNTYSCIKHRGIHKALKDVKCDIRDKEGTKYCLKLDIRKFYPSVDHDILKAIIRRKIKDVRLLKLLDEIVDSAEGVPIGNYLSLFFANLYLAYFDHWVKEVLKVKYYYRYADDIVILASNKGYLHEIFEKIQLYITSLKLLIKDNWLIFEMDNRGLSFVGYVIRHKYIKLRKNIKHNMCSKAYKLSKLNLTEDEYKLLMCSYLGWAKHGDCKNLMKNILLYDDLLKYLD